MIKQKLLLWVLCSTISIKVNSQIVLQVNAGSRAPWGSTQNLLVDAKGNCSYKKSIVNGPVKDSSTFSISGKQLDSLFAKAELINFFGMNEKYDGGYSDGAGIFISIRSGSKKHHVELLNTDLPGINQFIGLLNRILAPHKVLIYYGQK